MVDIKRNSYSFSDGGYNESEVADRLPLRTLEKLLELAEQSEFSELRVASAGFNGINLEREKRESVERLRQRIEDKKGLER